MTHARSAADFAAILGVRMRAADNRTWVADPESASDANEAILLAGGLLRVNSLDYGLIAAYTAATVGATALYAMLSGVASLRSADGTDGARMLAACKVVTRDQVLLAGLVSAVVAAVMDLTETTLAGGLLRARAVPSLVEAWRGAQGGGVGAVASLPEACLRWPAACRPPGGAAGRLDDGAAFTWLYVSARARSAAMCVAWGALGVRLLRAAARPVRPQAGRAARVRAGCGSWFVEADEAKRYVPGAALAVGAALLGVAAGAPLWADAVRGTFVGAEGGWQRLECLSELGLVLCGMGLVAVGASALYVWFQASTARDANKAGPDEGDAF